MDDLLKNSSLISPANQAFRKILSSINRSKKLPDQVFEGEWSRFRFFVSTQILLRSFIPIAKNLMNVEGSSCLCLVDFTRLGIASEKEAVLTITHESTETGYLAAMGDMVKVNIPNSIISLDLIACSTEIGSWCIYAEGANSAAVIGFRDPDDIDKFSVALDMLGAKPIRSLLDLGFRAGIPYGYVPPEWRESVLRNYP